MLIRVFQPIRWFLADIKVGVVMSETCNNTRDWKGVSAPGKSGKISKWVKYNSGQNVLDTCLSCKENAIQVNPSPPDSVGCYKPRGWGRNLVRAGLRVCIAGSCKFHTKMREKGEVLIPKPFDQDCSSHKKAHSNATNLFYWGNGNTYSKRNWITVRHTSINMVVLYRVTIS